MTLSHPQTYRYTPFKTTCPPPTISSKTWKRRQADIYKKFLDTNYDTLPSELKKLHPQSTLLPVHKIDGLDRITMTHLWSIYNRSQSLTTKLFISTLTNNLSTSRYQIRLKIKQSAVSWFVQDRKTSTLYTPTTNKDDQELIECPPPQDLSDYLKMTTTQFERLKQAGKRLSSHKETRLNTLTLMNRHRPNCNQTTTDSNGKVRKVHKSPEKGYPNLTQIGDVGPYHTLIAYGTKNRELRDQEITRSAHTSPEKKRQLFNNQATIDCDHITQKALATFSPTALSIERSPRPVHELIKQKNKRVFVHKNLKILRQLILDIYPFSKEEKACHNTSWTSLKSHQHFWLSEEKLIRFLSKKIPMLKIVHQLVELVSHRFSKKRLSEALQISKTFPPNKELLTYLDKLIKDSSKDIRSFERIINKTQQHLSLNGLCIAVPSAFHRQTKSYLSSPNRKDLEEHISSNTPKQTLGKYFNDQLFEDYGEYFTILQKYIITLRQQDAPSTLTTPNLDILYFVGSLRYHYKQCKKQHALPNSDTLDKLFNNMISWALKHD